MSFIDPWEIKEEIVVFLRNRDVLTTTERSVTTTTASGTLSNETTITISRTNVKNIRSITVDAVAKSLGTDYNVDYTNNAGATQNCVITFGAAQSGAYVVSYDYGSDVIFPDFPRPDLSLSSYPRISVDVLGSNSREVALGGATVATDVSITVVAYASSAKKVETMIKSIRNAFLSYKKSFYNVKFITCIGMGPLLKSPDRHDKIMQRNVDFIAPLNYEEA